MMYLCVQLYSVSICAIVYHMHVGICLFVDLCVFAYVWTCKCVIVLLRVHNPDLFIRRYQAIHINQCLFVMEMIKCKISLSSSHSGVC